MAPTMPSLLVYWE
ncbi:Protein of unknown function [Lactobacillus helveticus CIRM-BIA 953]|uniref:Uncharacterized protein n=1 Tax=Lactobacillus helveticus CIRM-BIA 953 TaxID=1226335 RepID=U4QEM9_LACHE|nr:Protein of unknown function [Lactobacillus helveticus CIRM-BIA 953]